MGITEDIQAARLLIVDDQESNVVLLQTILEAAGYHNIDATTDPREVFDLYRRNHYDLILLDLSMPHMSGFEVMEALKPIETGGYLGATGNDFWGVEVFVRDGLTYILGSDRDFGLFIFRRND